MRVKSIYDFDPDYRGNARGEVWCVLCQKALRPNAKYRFLHLINGGVDVLHPDDEALYTPDGGDLGAHPVGNECVKKCGEWATKDRSIALVKES